MPVMSTVQTPQLFRGSLKEYQLKGLQWLVNCYEQVVRHINEYLDSRTLLLFDSLLIFTSKFCCCLQGLNGILADEMGLGKTIQAMAFLAHLAEVILYMAF